MKLLKQVTLDRASRKKDRSVSITFITNLEQSSKDFMEIDNLLTTSGILYFKEGSEMNTEEIKAIDEHQLEIKDGATESQKTRYQLKLYWQQLVSEDKYTKDFNTFYRAMQEQYRKDIFKRMNEL